MNRSEDLSKALASRSLQNPRNGKAMRFLGMLSVSLLVSSVTIFGGIAALGETSETKAYFIGVDDLDGSPGDEVVTVTRANDGSASWVEARRVSNGAVLWSHRAAGRVGKTAIDPRFIDGSPYTFEGVRLLAPGGTSSAGVAFVNFWYRPGPASGPGVGSASGVAVTALDGASGEMRWRYEMEPEIPTAEALVGSSGIWAYAMAGTLEFDLFNISDVNGDAVQDLVLTIGIGHNQADYEFGLYGQGRSRRNTAWVLSGADGDLLHRVVALGGRSIRPIEDLRGYGFPSLLEIGTDLVARTLTGSVLWAVRNVNAEAVHEVELDGDTRTELITCKFHSPFDDPDQCAGGAGGAVAIDGDDGSIIWRGSGQLPSDLWVAGDLDGDGLDDLIARACTQYCASRKIRALYGHSLATIWEVEANWPAMIDACCEDVNGDGVKDVLYREGGTSTARSGADGAVMWAVSSASPYYPARGDLNQNGTRDLVSLTPRGDGVYGLLVYEGSTLAFLWEAGFRGPANQWIGDTREASGKPGSLPALVLAAYPTSGEETAACRVHVMDGTGLIWSHPDCPIPEPATSPSPVPTSTATG